MILFLLLLCFVLAAAIAPTIAQRHRTTAFATTAVPFALSAFWAIATVVQPPESAARLEWQWVPGLDLEVALLVTPTASLLASIVAGIGLLVVVYASGYFDDEDPTVGRFLAVLTLFAGAMFGLVLSDSVWSLFLFWEATSITSFLLVGHKTHKATARAAARRALMITGAGGLALLAGLLLLTEATGTARLSEMDVAHGTVASIASALIVVAAATKSALVPFHVWLPGAMEAPTPVSAYLHSATMVKAGVLLIAVAGPVLGGLTAFTATAQTFGIVTMLVGAIGALRQRDAKLILAWGTVSQLGLMVTLLGLGTPKATFAAVAMLSAHAIFKAGLFMVVGEIDVRAGTRDIDTLRGLRGSMPVAFAATIALAMSMAGVPLVLGFTTKEAAVEAVLALSGTSGIVAATAVIGGAVVTVAYTVFAVMGMFGDRAPQASSPTEVSPRRWAMTVPPVALAGISVIGWVLASTAGEPVAAAAGHLDPAAGTYGLIAWPGLKTAFIVSIAALIAGALLGTAHSRRALLDAATTPTGGRADRALDGAVVPSRWLVARVQHGSLPVYLLIMAVTVAAASAPFVLHLLSAGIEIRWADSRGQAALAFAVVASAGACAVVSSRIGAALGLGVVGLAVTGLFVVHGAPDLVLTQLLVETVIVVGFVVGLGKLRRRFPEVASTWRAVRVIGSFALAVAVATALLSAGASPAPMLPVDRLMDTAPEIGGGNNVVNVILTDVRALDTLGEILVLGVAALGVLALASPRREHARPPRDDGAPDPGGPQPSAPVERTGEEVRA